MNSRTADTFYSSTPYDLRNAQPPPRNSYSYSQQFLLTIWDLISEIEKLCNQHRYKLVDLLRLYLYARQLSRTDETVVELNWTKTSLTFLYLTYAGQEYKLNWPRPCTIHNQTPSTATVSSLDLGEDWRPLSDLEFSANFMLAWWRPLDCSSLLHSEM